MDKTGDDTHMTGEDTIGLPQTERLIIYLERWLPFTKTSVQQRSKIDFNPISYPQKNLWVIVFASGQPLQLQLLAWRTQQSRLLDDGRVHCTLCILDGNRNR